MDKYTLTIAFSAPDVVHDTPRKEFQRFNSTSKTGERWHFLPIRITSLKRPNTPSILSMETRLPQPVTLSKAP